MATQSKSGKPAITGKRKISHKKSPSALDNAVKNKAKKVAASSLHDDDDNDELYHRNITKSRYRSIY